jgi:hypothetical protein
MIRNKELPEEMIWEKQQPSDRKACAVYETDKSKPKPMAKQHIAVPFC